MFADITNTDLAYAAGFIDADGCVTVSRASLKVSAGFYSYRIGVVVSNKTPHVPEWFCSAFGGCVKIQQQSKPGYPPMHAWCLYNNRAADFLETIVPYLKLKQQRALHAIDLARLQRPRGRGFHIPIEQLKLREQLAISIRTENIKTSARAKMFIPQEFN